MLYSRRTSQKHWCNVQLADKVMLISIISLKVIFAHAPVLSNLIHKTCAVTLIGKRPPNRDLELQLTELVQDTQTLMVQDTKALMVHDTKALMVHGTKALMVQDTKALMVQDTRALMVQDTKP